MEPRVETDAYGAVEIPAGAYWGPQTQRSRQLFAIGADRLPVDVVHCFGALKAAAARANRSLGLLPDALADAVAKAAQEMCDGRFDDQFPVALWQTGSGTQTNMNANEVIANRANELLGRPLGSRSPVHPNDHVNLGQSSNDTFPTIMHLCVVRAVFDRLAPATAQMQEALRSRADGFHGILKLGMTHLQDALPVTLGMEFRTWERQIGAAWAAVEARASDLCELPQGGTASGSGVNGRPEFARLVVAELGDFAGRPLSVSEVPSRFMSAHDGFVGLCGALDVLASALLKICTDIRLLTSSLGGRPAMILPDEGLSSSIMPAKRNATVCEAVTQVCLRVMGNSSTVLAANNVGALQLNTCKPLILNEVIASVCLLADAQRALVSGCIEGLQADAEQLRRSLETSPVIGAILAPIVGYDVAAQVTRHAASEGLSIREAAARCGVMTVAAFDAHLAEILDPDQLDRGFSVEETQQVPQCGRQ